MRVTAARRASIHSMRISESQRCFVHFQETGDPASLARVFELAAPVLLRIARRTTRDSERAADALQSTFLVAIERRASFDRTRPVEAWLFGILIREIAARRRREAREIDAARLPAASAASDDPLEIVANEEIVRELVAALEHLPERDRAALEPWMRGERPQRADDRASIPGSTLRMRVHRALQSLRNSLPIARFALAPLTNEERTVIDAVRARVLRAGGMRAGQHAASTALTRHAWSPARLGFWVTAAVVVVAGLRYAHDGSGQSNPTAAQSAAVEPLSVRGERSTASAEPQERESVRSTASRPASGSSVVAGRGGAEVHAIEVVIVDDDRSPIPRARVRVLAERTPRVVQIAEGVTDDAGRFTTSVGADTELRLVVEHPEFARIETQATPFGQPSEIVMRRGQPFAGEVVAPDDRSAPFARVEVFDGCARFVGPIELRADETGHFSLSYAERVRFVRATAESGTLRGEAFASSGERSVVVKLSAPKGRVFHVRERESRQSVQDAFVLLVSRAATDPLLRISDLSRVADWEVVAPYARWGRTDSQGLVRFDDVASERLDVVVTAPNHATVVQSLRSAEPATTIECELDPMCSIRGRVEESDGRPIRDGRVYLDPDAFDSPHHSIEERELLDAPSPLLADGTPNPFAISTTTQADGSFRLDGLAAVPTILTVMHRNRVAHREIAPPAPGSIVDGLVIRIGARVSIEGTIRTEDGAALDCSPQIWIHPSSSRATFEGDRFHLECEPRSSIKLWVVAPGYLRESVEVAAMTSQHDVAIVLRRGAAIRGRIVSADGTPIGGAKIAAWPAQPTAEEISRRGGWITEMALATARSGDDGRFEIRGLGPRTVELKVRAEGFADRVLGPLEPGAEAGDIELGPR